MCARQFCHIIAYSSVLVHMELMLCTKNTFYQMLWDLFCAAQSSNAFDKIRILPRYNSLKSLVEIMLNIKRFWNGRFYFTMESTFILEHKSTATQAIPSSFCFRPA